MTKEYQVGEKALLVVKWLTQTGEAATVTGTPTITIKKYDPSDDSWTTKVNAQNMTQESGSNYGYEYNTTGETAEYDYFVVYSAVVDGLTVYAAETFRLITEPATQADVRELRIGNIRMDFSIATVADSGRNVAIGMVDYMTVKTKADGDSDWTSATSSKVLYFYYDSSGRCTARKEND